LSIARRELENTSELQERDIRYYMNPEFTSDRNECRFRKEFVPRRESRPARIFREPDNAERAALLTSEHPACVRYAAALEAAKQRAKALAASDRPRSPGSGARRPKWRDQRRGSMLRPSAAGRRGSSARLCSCRAGKGATCPPKPAFGRRRMRRARRNNGERRARFRFARPTRASNGGRRSGSDRPLSCWDFVILWMSEFGG